MVVPWEQVLDHYSSCNEKLSNITDIINYGLNTIMPEQSVKIHQTDRPWLNPDLKRLISKRQKAFASGNKPLFNLLRNKVNRERKRCRKVYYNNKVWDLKDTRPRDWWREVKQLCGNARSSCPDLRSILRTNTSCTDQQLANKINRAYVSVMEDYTPLADDIFVPCDDDEPISVSVDQVAIKLKQIRVSRAGGPDNLPNWVFKTYSDILAPALTEVLNQSFEESKVSRVWKLADVPPLPKGKSIEDFNKDLRPISLTSTLSKVAEGFVIEKDLKPVLLKCIDPNQYGFIPNSCTTMLLLLHHWLEATDGSGSHVRVALLDYKKAFDLVDHNLLISKLYSVGVKPTVVNWICDFLRNRSQRVKLDSSCFSEFVNVPAGIPQGTKIGPWLFLAMINDLSTTSALWKFADDTTLAEVIPKSSTSTLQNTVDGVLKWTDENVFGLNPTKCKEMQIDFCKKRGASTPLESEGKVQSCQIG